MNLFNEDAITCAQHLLLIPEKATWSVHQIINDELIFCDNVKLNKVTQDMNIIVNRGSEIIRKLKTLNQEIAEYNILHRGNDDVEHKASYDVSGRLSLGGYETLIEEESSDVVKVTFTPYNQPEEYPSQYFIFERQRFIYY
jgi:hypothetical protein